MSPIRVLVGHGRRFRGSPALALPSLGLGDSVYSGPVSYAAPPRRRKSWYRGLPVWLQWLLPLGSAAILIVALVIWVHYETNDVPSEAGVNSASAIAQQNHIADVLIGQQQQPHVVALKSGVAPIAALRQAVIGYMKAQIKHTDIDGPLQKSSCRRVAGSPASRQLYKCTSMAANVVYPFDGVISPASHQITYCKVDPPPVRSMRIPVSSRCT